jgi:pimeloyl-ACP methyl ester carboxylesterase
MPWTFPYLGETKELNDAVRANAPGSFARLSDGLTHYELGGAINGQPVVLVHGFSVPYFIWDPTFAFLTKSGFRVLRYDLFGRGFSDRPPVSYNIDVFCKQLRELANTLDLERFHLIGLSMGGPITASFATRHPEMVQKLVLVDPSGAKPITLSRLLKGATTPGFGELVFGLFGSGHMIKSVESDFYNPIHIRDFVKKYMVQMKYKGYLRAILSTVRTGMLGEFSSTFWELGKLGIPTMLLWGRKDKTVPFAHSDVIRKAIPQVEFHAIDNCGHLPHYEKPEEVNPLLLEFLK